MVKIVVPRESEASETRCPLTPMGAKKLIELGAEVWVEKGVGEGAVFPDSAYQSAGAKLAPKAELLTTGDLVLRLRKPGQEDIRALKPGAVHISFLDPFDDPETVRALATQGVSAISMEMIPRTTKAQKMDALSSQANLGGYVALILATHQLKRILPMMTTPAGTIPPARVFIIGAGVAGLQAIATARRLGARVEAYDTRAVVEEQVKSLGARFAKIDIGDTGQTKDGYAKQLTDEQLEMQRQAMGRFCAQSDILITTAQLFGRKAPLIVTDEMVRGMKPGSVIVDMAAESGGNVAGTRAGEIVEVNGVSIVGLLNLPGLVPVDASTVYSNNLVAMVGEFWDHDEKVFRLDQEDEILQGCLLTHAGRICNERLKDV